MFFLSSAALGNPNDIIVASIVSGDSSTLTCVIVGPINVPAAVELDVGRRMRSAEDVVCRRVDEVAAEDEEAAAAAAAAASIP